MRTFVRQNSLSLFFALIFLAALVGQAFAGHADYNAQQVTDGLATVSLGRYLTSSSFAVDVAENWQSEYLQFLLYILATVWLLQRGSPESKSLDQAGTESDQKQKTGRFADENSPALARGTGPASTLYSWSLGLVMGAIFLASWGIQSLAGRVAYNEEQLAQLQAPVSWLGYVTSADFWNRTLQNWQSEFLAVGSMAVLSIYLRQRGSPESKPVGSAHTSTGVEG
jgi:uncharacterized protein DUF6766